MRALLHTEIAALLSRAGVGQAAFARLAGVTARQVNNWTRGRAAVPPWAALLAVGLEDTPAEALLLTLKNTQLECHQVLGVPYGADMATIRQAMQGLALLCHPDKGVQPEQMVVVNAAYAEAAQAVSRAS